MAPSAVARTRSLPTMKEMADVWDRTAEKIKRKEFGLYLFDKTARTAGIFSAVCGKIFHTLGLSGAQMEIV